MICKRQILLHAFHKRYKIFLSTPDNPVRHGLSGDIYTIALKLLLDSVQCRGVHIFYIQNGCKQGRSNDASTQKVLGTFSETIAVRYAHLFDQPLDVLIQGIQLSRSLNCFHYNRKHKGLRTCRNAGSVTLPMPVWRCDGHRTGEI